MAQHNELGVLGEEQATRLLKTKKYLIVERNWKFLDYEIDIIALDGNFIVFVEVKTRTSVEWGNPEDFVGKVRQRRMVEAANYYLVDHKIDNPARFDIIGVIWDGKSYMIDHIEDAFMAS